MFISATAMHCEQVYRRTGFAFEEKNKFPGDHAGIELRYFACLLARRAMALEAPPAVDTRKQGEYNFSRICRRILWTARWQLDAAVAAGYA